MTVFSMLTTVSAVALLTLPSSGGKITFDLLSNGRYWWGGPWVHEPKDGQTNECICIKGQKMNGDVDAVCSKGLKLTKTGNWFIGGIHSPVKEIPFDGNYPIDISTHGGDAAWIDRILFETNAGSRWKGSDNTSGWCLSQDRDDKFDKWATHSGCYTTFSFHPNGRIVADRGTSGYWRQSSLVTKSEQLCAALGRRRVENDALVDDAGSFADFDDLVDAELLDADPSGENPNQVHNEVDALVVGKLHQAIRDMVRENSDVTFGQIDRLLNSAMVEVEDRVGHDGEALELNEASDDAEAEAKARGGSAGTGTVQGRLQDLEGSS